MNRKENEQNGIVKDNERRTRRKKEKEEGEEQEEEEKSMCALLPYGVVSVLP